jgi:precorrin-6B methylase 2
MRKTTWIAAIAALFLFAIITNAQEYEPSVGQQGKDVIWVPTPDELVDAMLDLAKVTRNDYVMDLGSGDGRIVVAAAKRGAHAVGIEFNPDMVELSKRRAEKAGVSDKASFVNGDIFETDLSKATVVSMYLLPSLNMKLRPTILDLKPGTRVVTNSFTMEDWQSDESATWQGRTAYLWIVPAKVQGTWTWTSNPGSAELKLTQTFQKIDGSLTVDGKTLALKDPKLHGSHISFACGDQEYSGVVNGKSIEGTVKAKGREQKWSATLQ